MIYRIGVWEKTSGDSRFVGEMISEFGEASKPRSAFRYGRTYLEDSSAFPLDPVTLPLTAESFTTSDPSMFGIFEDSLPDDWGKRLLVRQHNIPRNSQNPPNLLLALGNSGLGTLSYSDNTNPADSPQDTSIIHLSELLTAAEHFERGDLEETGLSLLFGAGSSPGGARPKAVVFDEGDRNYYIAKFPSVKDQEDVVKIEFATMETARLAGLNVPDTRLVQCASKSVLLVHRFDIIPAGRRHMISFQTLLKAHGFYQLRYQDLLAVLRKYSNDPQEDSELFFRQMVFNAVVGNTDDHLKNFWIVFDHQQGWRLSPAFDLIPNIGRNDEHVLLFDTSAYFPGRVKLEKLGKQWGIHNSANIVAQVFDAVACWRTRFNNAGVPDVDTCKFKEIDSNLVS
ncbi:MAG: type II toxin-antitoxin system HipA family toxin [Desulfuromonadaceae bacterium]|nr:type II toxin-antitoxin system HipA family toxin [Desulfuromonadaceae bacterium]